MITINPTQYIHFIVMTIFRKFIFIHILILKNDDSDNNRKFLAAKHLKLNIFGRVHRDDLVSVKNPSPADLFPDASTGILYVKDGAVFDPNLNSVMIEKNYTASLLINQA